MLVLKLPWDFTKLNRPSRSRRRFDLFLSHAGPDKPLVVEAYLFLSAVGFKCFYDQTSIVDKIWLNLVAGVADSALMAVMLSPAYFDSARSTWPQLEALTMMARGDGGDKGNALVYPVFLMDRDAARFAGAVVHGSSDTVGRTIQAGGNLGCEATGCCSSLNLGTSLKKIVSDLFRRCESRSIDLSVTRGQWRAHVDVDDGVLELLRQDCVKARGRLRVANDKNPHLYVSEDLDREVDEVRARHLSK